MKPSSRRVLELLRERGPAGLTQLDCLANGGGSRLAARVADLRADGYQVESDLIVVPTRGGGARVARYRLHEAKPEQLRWSA